jgi:hypothetical protein
LIDHAHRGFEMRIRSILALPILALVFSLVPPRLLSVAQAARITAPGLHVKAFQADEKKTNAVWPSDPVLCDLILDGDVEQGDAASLQQNFQAIVGKMNAFSFFLCLRSSGGDLGEAVKIAQFVLQTQRPSIATVVEDGQTCASACAIIFLAGNAPARVGAFPQRFLHPRGKLLYHSSRLDLSRFSDKDLLAFLTEQTPDPRGLKGKIVDLYKDGLRDVQSVIATFQRFTSQREDLGDRWVRPSLFLEMFAQDADEWICVDTIDAVGRWNIQVYGYQPPQSPRKQDYSNVCRSAYHWRSDQFAVDAADDLEDEGELRTPPASTTLSGRNKSNAGFDSRFTMSFQAPFQPLNCIVELKYDYGKKQLDSQSTLTTFFLPTGGFTPGAVIVSELSPVAYYPAATLLRDLPGIRPDRGATKTRPAVRLNDYPNTVMNGCSYKLIPKMERAACASACAADAACQGYSHNTITQACELKHTMTARRLHPLWTSGSPSGGPAPGRSVRADTMVTYDELAKNVRLVNNARIAGKLIDEANVATSEACSDRCKSDAMCLAMEFTPSTNVCRRFSEMTGFREASPVENEFIDVKIKKQQ